MRFPLLIGTLLVSMMVFSRCQSDNHELSEEKLVDLLVDVQVAEAMLKMQGSHFRDSLAAAYYQQIAEMHDMSVQEMLETIEEVNRDPRRMAEVYEQVLEALNRQDAIDASE